MKYTIFDASRGACSGKPKCARVVKRHSSGVKHFPSGVKKNLGGFNPPLTLPENPPWTLAMLVQETSMLKKCVFFSLLNTVHTFTSSQHEHR